MWGENLFCVSLFITLIVLSSHARNLEEIIWESEAESNAFTQSENRYARTSQRPSNIGYPFPPMHPVLEPVVYEKVTRQRPFEFIGERAARFSWQEIERSPRYQRLVSSCKQKQSQPECVSNYKYRTYDGTCNNLENPRFGSAMNCYSRLFDARYEGISGIRRSVCGGPLPPPRDISLQVNKGVNNPSANFSEMLPFLGQFLSHDLSDIPLSSINGTEIECCFAGEDQHPECAELYIRQDDPFYSNYKLTCINIFRAAICDTCSVGPRYPIDQTSSYIDLSLVYGQTAALTNSLRANDGTGELKVVHHKDFGDLLPIVPLELTRYCGNNREEHCFLAGDRRANQHTALMSLQTIFVREHNRIVTELKRINPHWEEERLFQEARNINIAQYQFIVFNELIPLLVEPELMIKYKLCVSVEGTTQYDPQVDATLLVEFPGAAYRLHNLVNGVMVTHDELRNGWFRNLSENAVPLYHGGLSSLLQDSCLSPANKFDRYVTADLTNFLHKSVSGEYGYDVAAINIMRGRDLGLPTYVEVVKDFSEGRIAIDGFEDLEVVMDKQNIEDLRRVYCDVRDIDLWIGLMSERSREGSIVGRTAEEIIALQINKLKYGDRFYFEHQGNFNARQLRAFKRTTFAGIMCSNSNVEKMHLRALQLPNTQWPEIPCETIEKINLALWKETR